MTNGLLSWIRSRRNATMTRRPAEALTELRPTRAEHPFRVVTQRHCRFGPRESRHANPLHPNRPSRMIDAAQFR